MTWYGHQCQQGQDNNVQSPIVTDFQENNKGVNNKTIYLKEPAGNTTNILAKLNKGEYVSMNSLAKICRALDCDIGDICVINEVNKK